MPTTRRTRRPQWLARTAEGLVALAAVLLPLLVGGALPEAFVAAGALGSLSLVFASLARGPDGLPLPPAGAALAGGTMLALVSLVHWPAALVGLLSPRARALATLPPEAEAGFLSLTLDGPLTLVDAARLVGLTGLCFAAAALARREERAHRLAVVLLGSATLVAVVTAFHSLADARTLFGLYVLPLNVPLRGPFVNPNHAASVGLLGAAVAVGLWTDAREAWVRSVVLVAGGVCAGLVVASLSIAGLGALALAGGLAWVWASRRPSSRGASFPWPLLVLGVMVTVLLGAALLLPSHVDALGEGGEHKWQPWPATLDLVRAHLLTGVGRGVFGLAFEAFAAPGTPTLATYPENFLLHWMAEWGLPAAVAGVVLLAATFLRGAREALAGTLGPVGSALLAGSLGVFVHDLADYGLEMAAVGALVAIALGVAWGRGESRRRLPSSVGVGVGIVGLAISSLALATGLPTLADRQLTAVAEQPPADAAGLDQTYRTLRRQHPTDPFLHLRAADSLLQRAVSPVPPEERGAALRLALPFAGRVLELSRRDRAHLTAARALFLAGRRPQALAELRAAFVATAVGWLPLDEAVRWNATAEEVASILQASIVAIERGETAVPRAATNTLSAALDYLGPDLGRIGLTWGVAKQLLQDPAGGMPLNASVLRSACAAAAADGWCRTGPRCSRSPDGREQAEFMLALAGRFPADPIDDVAEACIAEAHLLLGDEPRAMEVLREAIGRKPAALKVRMRLAELLLKQGRGEAAAATLSRISAPADQVAARWLLDLRVRALLAADRPERAAAELATAVGQSGHLAWPHVAQARYLAASGRRDDALRAYDRALDVAEPQEKESILAERGAVDRTVAPPPGNAPSGGTVPRP